MRELNVAVVVYFQAGQLILVGLENADRTVADEASRGYSYAGSIAFVAGEPTVTIAPGYEIAMAYANTAFTQMLGPILKEHQLQTEGGN